MNGNGKEPAYRLVGILKNGEQITLISDTTEDVAEKVKELLRDGDFQNVRIEEVELREP